MFIRMLFVCYPIVFLLLISSCSQNAVVNSENVGVGNGTPNLNPPVTPESDPFLPETGSENCIKKDGWLLPPSNGKTTPERSDPMVIMMRTKSGKQVKVTQITYSYGYAHAWTYSQDLRCKGGDRDFLKGNFATPWYTELSVRSQVFAYSIFAKEVWEKPPSNSDAGEERFTYELRDDDGDGIFETLVHGGENLVPNWVLR